MAKEDEGDDAECEYEYYDEEYYDEEEEAGDSHLSLQHQDSQPTQHSPETESDISKRRFLPEESAEYYNKERDGRTQCQSEYVDSPRE